MWAGDFKMSEPADLSEPFNLAEDEHVSLQAVDPELDIKSEHFNPLKALLSTDVPIPIGDAPLYNNIAHYESTMKRQNTSALVSCSSVQIIWKIVKSLFSIPLNFLENNFYFKCLIVQFGVYFIHHHNVASSAKSAIEIVSSGSGTTSKTISTTSRFVFELFEMGIKLLDWSR